MSKQSELVVVDELIFGLRRSGRFVDQNLERGEENRSA